MKNHINILFVLNLILLGLTSCSASSFQPNNVSVEYSTPLWSGNTQTTWYQLQHQSTAQLLALKQTTTDANKRAWLQLAILAKQKLLSTQQLANRLIAFRAEHPFHPANELFPDNTVLTQLANQPAPKHIAVLLPQSGVYRPSGNAVRAGFMQAYQANQTQANQQSILFYDSAQATNIATLYQLASADGADLIVGPLTKDKVQELSQTHAFTTPVLALNYTDLRQGPLKNNFYEFGLLTEDETSQIVKRARLTHLSRALVIAPENDWGKKLTHAFTTEWQANGGTLVESWHYTPNKTDFSLAIAQLLKINLNVDKELTRQHRDKTQLEQQRRHDFDVVFLFTPADDAHIIVPLLHYYYVNNIPMFATSSIYDGQANANRADFSGVTVCDIPHATNRLYAVGQDAYQLSQSLPRLAALPHFPLYANTGALALKDQQIHRRLPCRTL